MPFRPPPHPQPHRRPLPAWSCGARRRRRWRVLPAAQPLRRHFEWIAQRHDLATIPPNRIRTPRRLQRAASVQFQFASWCPPSETKSLSQEPRRSLDIHQRSNFALKLHAEDVVCIAANLLLAPSNACANSHGTSRLAALSGCNSDRCDDAYLVCHCRGSQERHPAEAAKPSRDEDICDGSRGKNLRSRQARRRSGCVCRHDQSVFPKAAYPLLPDPHLACRRTGEHRAPSRRRPGVMHVSVHWDCAWVLPFCNGPLVRRGLRSTPLTRAICTQAYALNA